MRLALCVLAFVAGATHAPLFAQEDLEAAITSCATLDNDIARLQCYDDAVKGLPKPRQTDGSTSQDLGVTSGPDADPLTDIPTEAQESDDPPFQPFERCTAKREPKITGREPKITGVRAVMVTRSIWVHGVVIFTAGQEPTFSWVCARWSGPDEIEQRVHVPDLGPLRDTVVGKVTVVSSEGDTSVFLVKLKHHSDETQSQWHLILGTPGEFEVVPIDEKAKEMVDGRESGDAP